MLDRNTKILIIGLGVIGGSYARALSEKGYSVRAVDRDENTLLYAKRLGWIEEGYLSAEESVLRAADLIVYALYPAAMLKEIRRCRDIFSAHTVITDACGVKRSTVYAAQTLLREAKTPSPHAEFIAAHPMGGKESRGIENADPQIFSQANYLIVPTRENTTHGEKICLELAQTIGFRSVSLLSPEEHDETIAFVSQLPHWIAVALTTCRETETLAPYTGDSFRDLTRIAKINADLWCELFAENKDDLLRQADLFFEQFQYIRRLIAEGDYDELKRVMRLASQRRTKFDEIQDFRQKDRKTPQRIEFENAESRTNDNAPNEEKSPLGAGE